MNPQWLEMRIQEEQERRRKEAKTQELLPRAMENLHSQLSECVDRYKEVFGTEAASISNLGSKLAITVRDLVGGKWQQRDRIEVNLVSMPPSFKVERGEGEPKVIEVGLLPDDRLSYRLNDQYLTTEDLSRQILDRPLFPKLVE
jgi:hypothetical protein